VALETEERFLVGKQIREYGAMCIVADSTVISEIGMLKGERADELSVTVDTQTLHVHGFDTVRISRAVGVVAVRAQHNALRYRVPGGEGELGLDLVVTGKTQIVDLFPVSLLLGALVKLVAILASHFPPGVFTFGPELDVDQRVRTVALQAKQGLGACRQLPYGYELAGVALFMFLDVILGYGLASGAVTALTVNQGHLSSLDLELPVDTFIQQGGILVVGVAGREAGLVTDVIGKQ